MRNCAYRILEYAKSDLERDGSVFAAVLRFQDAAARNLRGWILTDWKSLVEEDREREIGYIEDFLFDLRQQSRKQDASAFQFFESIDDLCTGPIRTKMSGVCQIRDLLLIHPELSEERDVTFCSNDVLDSLVREIALTGASPRQENK